VGTTGESWQGRLEGNVPGAVMNFTNKWSNKLTVRGVRVCGVVLLYCCVAVLC
jgi:hypothetical protein